MTLFLGKIFKVFISIIRFLDSSRSSKKKNWKKKYEQVDFFCVFAPSPREKIFCALEYQKKKKKKDSSKRFYFLSFMDLKNIPRIAHNQVTLLY